MSNRRVKCSKKYSDHFSQQSEVEARHFEKWICMTVYRYINLTLIKTCFLKYLLSNLICEYM